MVCKPKRWLQRSTEAKKAGKGSRAISPVSQKQAVSLNQASVSLFQERQTLFVGLACALLVANGIAKMDTSIAERRANHGERAALANDVEFYERGDA